MKTVFLLTSAAALIISAGAFAQDANSPATVPTDMTMPAPATPDAATPAATPMPEMPGAMAPTQAAPPAAPGDAKTYPVCSAKVKDSCVQRGAMHKRR